MQVLPTFEPGSLHIWKRNFVKIAFWSEKVAKSPLAYLEVARKLA
jgi:hypothetical protein